MVNQLHVGEQQEEGNDGPPVAVPQRYTKAGQSKEGEMDVHPPSRPRLHPREPGIVEVVGGLDIHLRDPTVGHEPHHSDKAEQAEDDAESGQRGWRHRLASSLDKPFE